MSTKRVQIIGGFPQADWNQTDETAPDYIKNKPNFNADEFASTIETIKSDMSNQDAVILAESQLYTDRKIGDLKTETSNQDAVVLAESQAYTDEQIAAIAATSRLQSDWAQSDDTATDYIKNKPFGDNSDGTVTKIDDKYLSIVDEGKIKGEYLPDDIAGSNYPIVDGIAELQPDTYYVFGEVDELAVTLVEVNDGTLHEYCFEFTASENFTGLTITPTPNWANHPQCVPGKTHQVTVLRGIGVMVCA